MIYLLTEVFAHRGASMYAPENTMSAFKKAHELGSDGIETDIHLTKDNIPVLIHDEDVKRTTNTRGLVQQYTFQELKQFDAGSWFAQAFKEEQIISLEQFLHWIQDKDLNMNIELKNNKIDYLHMEEIVYEQIKHYQLLERTIFSSFNPDSVKRLQQYSGEVEVAWLTSRKSRKLIKSAKELGANALHIKYPLLTKKLMKQAKRENISVRTYTINKISQMKNSFQEKCQAIITDLPDIAIRERKKYLL